MHDFRRWRKLLTLLVYEVFKVTAKWSGNRGEIARRYFEVPRRRGECV